MLFATLMPWESSLDPNELGLSRRGLEQKLRNRCRTLKNMHVLKIDQNRIPVSGCRYLFSVLLVVLASSGCRTPREEPRRAGVVARVGGEDVTDDDLRHEFWFGEEEVRRKSLQRGGRHFLLDRVIDDRLLFREAERRGSRPRFRDLQEFHERMMKSFLTAEFEPTVSPDEIPEGDVRAEYDRVSPGFASPETVELELGYFADKARGERTLKLALKAQADNESHRIDQVLREETDEWPPPLEIPETGIFSFDQASRFYGDEIAQIAFSMLPPNVIHTELLPYREGWLMLLVPLRHEAVPPPPFEEIERELRDQVFARHRDRALDAFVDTFRERHTVTIHAEILDLITWYEPLPSGAPQISGPSSRGRPPLLEPAGDPGAPHAPPHESEDAPDDAP
jgi:hypothetical protein